MTDDDLDGLTREDSCDLVYCALLPEGGMPENCEGSSEKG